jgi:hypothetical protein
VSMVGDHVLEERRRLPGLVEFNQIDLDPS